MIECDMYMQTYVRISARKSTLKHRFVIILSQFFATANEKQQATVWSRAACAPDALASQTNDVIAFIAWAIFTAVAAETYPYTNT